MVGFAIRVIVCVWMTMLVSSTVRSADDAATSAAKKDNFSTRSVEGQPGPTDMRRAVSKMLREESLATNEAAKQAALVKLCDTYAAIRLHPLYEKSELLRGEAVRVRRRLISEADRLADRLTREQVPRPSTLTQQVDSALAELETTEQANEGNGGAGIADEAWALVELIQRTVHPDFWEATGGPGSIRYFAIKRVLVVRATTRVHEDLLALLRQL